MDADDDPLPLCPKCDTPMALELVTPRTAAPTPETWTYVCPSCREVIAFSEDLPDQTSAEAASGWS